MYGSAQPVCDQGSGTAESVSAPKQEKQALERGHAGQIQMFRRQLSWTHHMQGFFSVRDSTFDSVSACATETGTATQTGRSQHFCVFLEFARLQQEIDW